ncbi:MAG: MFS transporter [Fibrobacterota bacterium]|nr:MFS transporter [Fibrobacterota bacterium]QQS05388.1 MAG: MFS transporter [Fibrobacterota bacterium]
MNPNRAFAWVREINGSRMLGGLAMMFGFGAFVNIQFNPRLFHLRGLSEVEIGIVLALGSLASLFSPLLAGWWTDRLAKPRWVLAFYSIAGAAGLALLPHLHGLVPLMIGYFLIQVAFSPVSPMTQSFVLSSTEAGPGSFLVMRSMGTLGFLLVSLWLSRFLSVISLDQAYMVMGACLLAALPFLMLLGVRGRKFAPASSLRFRQVVGFLWDRKLMPLYFGCGIGFFCNSLGVSILPHLVTGPLGRSDADIARAWSVATSFEIVFMMLSIPFVHRFGLKRFVMLGLGATALRWALAALAGDYRWFLVAQSLHGLMVAGVFTGQSLALSRMLPPDRLASGTAAAALLNGGVMSVAGSFLSGWIWKWFGLVAVCWTTAFVAAAGFVFFWLYGPDPEA